VSPETPGWERRESSLQLNRSRSLAARFAIDAFLGLRRTYETVYQVARQESLNLYQSIHPQLSIYVLVAVMSVVALAQPSEARIVYTPIHVKVDSPYNLDLNHDGITDFTVQQIHHISHQCEQGPFISDTLAEAPAQGNGAVISATDPPFAAAIDRGVAIGSKQNFVFDAREMAFTEWGYLERGSCHFFAEAVGPWINVSNRYLGLEFQINGKIHYGWARLNVAVFGFGDRLRVTLTGYAYETIAGKSIKAGQKKEAADDPTSEDLASGPSLTNPIPNTRQSASLGVLALGAQGVPLWRRKEQHETAL
jgi:hypothetical protein